MSPEVFGLLAGGVVGALLLARGTRRDGDRSLVGARATVTAPVSWPRATGRVQLAGDEPGEEWPASTVPGHRFQPGDEVVVAWVRGVGGHRRLTVGPPDRALTLRPSFQWPLFVAGMVLAAVVFGVLTLADQQGWSSGLAMLAAVLAVTVVGGSGVAVWAVRRRRQLEELVGRAAVVRPPTQPAQGHLEVAIDGNVVPAVLAGGGSLPPGEWVEVVGVSGWSGLVVKPQER